MLDLLSIFFVISLNRMGDNHEVDTSSFRRAVWNYIHCMYGIRHDDYDYSQVRHSLCFSFSLLMPSILNET